MNTEAYLKTWNLYQSAWGPLDEEESRKLLAQSVADHIVYTDPRSQTYGIDALAERIGESRRQFPGASFRNDSLLEHHGQGLFQWTMYDAQGAVFVRGCSFAHFGDDGRLVQATGFFAIPKAA